MQRRRLHRLPPLRVISDLEPSAEKFSARGDTIIMHSLGNASPPGSSPANDHLNPHILPKGSPPFPGPLVPRKGVRGPSYRVWVTVTLLTGADASLGDLVGILRLNMTWWAPYYTPRNSSGGDSHGIPDEEECWPGTIRAAIERTVVPDQGKLKFVASGWGLPRLSLAR